MTSSQTLFPDPEVRQSIDNKLSHKLENIRLHAGDRSVSPDIDMEKFRENLAQKTFAQTEDLDVLIDWTMESLEHGIVQMTHPGCFGLFNPSPSFPAECADRIASAFNPQICVWSHAPVAVEIENHVIAQITHRIGLPKKSGGHFTSGGSEANNTAVLCALTSAEPDYAEHGVTAFKGQPRIYVSKESHLAWLKIAHMTGIGRQAVRLIETDGMGKMNAKALEQTIQSDQAKGDVPFMIAATAGTTNAGMVDPLHSCADIAERYKTWYHVDAAWGGAIISSPKYRSALDGIERADSITIDAHKWFATTMGAGMYLTSRPSVLCETFRVSASYMPTSNVVDDLYVNTIQWSRRFVGLRLFLSLGAAGWSGYAKHIEHSIELIDRLITQVTDKGWHCVNNSPMAVACLTPPSGNGSVEEHVARIVKDGNHWISSALFEGQPVMRVCVTNGRTTKAGIDKLVNDITCN